MKTLVLGLGNPILSDDGVGICIIEELQKRRFPSEVTIAKTYLGGINLLELLVGYEKVVLIDAIQTKDGMPGTVYRLGSEALDSTNHIASSHEVNFTDILKLGKRLGLSLPEEICAYAIEVFDVNTFSEVCTEKVRQAIPEVVEKVLKELNNAIPNTANY